MIIELKKEFNKVADEFRDSYLEHPEDYVENSNIVVPLHDEFLWRSFIQANNCYNYAIDYQDNNFLQPGQLYLQSLPHKERVNVRKQYGMAAIDKPCSPEEYGEMLIRKAVDDGLKYLGTHPQKLKDAFPVALFIRKDSEKPWLNGYHWFALRQRENTKYVSPLGWFHKNGDSCVNDCGQQTIFHIADRYGLRHFAGYFAVNKDKLKTPENKSSLRDVKKKSTIFVNGR